MMFEQAVPAGTKSWFHLHHHSDEVAWVLEGEFSFKIGDVESKGGPGTCAFMPRNVPHAWKNCGSMPGRVLFLYTPAIAGRFVERMIEGLKSQEERGSRSPELDQVRVGIEEVGAHALGRVHVSRLLGTDGDLDACRRR
jgi:uncharacterized RmlC-like cupin family protein